jgi:small GTP-binding protein
MTPAPTADFQSPSNAGGATVKTQASPFQEARFSLQSTLNRYTQLLRSPRQRPLRRELQAGLKTECNHLASALDKLDQRVIRIATFGLVSRGKSAVLNALLGQKILQTGPINGVTQWPRSVRWLPPAGSASKVQIELIDTPGLDEIEGQARAQMARDIAQQADLILFVAAGDITRTEYQALCELRTAQKPLLLVFNKIDLYPEQDRHVIYQKLLTMFATHPDGQQLQTLISEHEVVMVAAEPAPQQVRIEWPDGRVTHEWETAPPQVDALKQRILELLNQEGQALLALNAMLQAKAATHAIAQMTLDYQKTEAEAIIWQFARAKAVAVGLNPFMFLDLLGGFMADLTLIRSLARLYGLPMTSYQASKLWKTILLNSGGLLLSEWGSGLLLGLGKSGAIAGAVANADFPSAALAQVSVGVVQGMVAGYGSYAIGHAAQVYLERGCTWGPEGPDTIIKNILKQVDRNTVLFRLRQELGQ